MKPSLYTPCQVVLLWTPGDFFLGTKVMDLRANNGGAGQARKKTALAYLRKRGEGLGAGVEHPGRVLPLTRGPSSGFPKSDFGQHRLRLRSGAAGDQGCQEGAAAPGALGVKRD